MVWPSWTYPTMHYVMHIFGDVIICNNSTINVCSVTVYGVRWKHSPQSVSLCVTIYCVRTIFLDADVIFGDLLKIWDFNLAKSHYRNNYKLVLFILQLKPIKADNWRTTVLRKVWFLSQYCVGKPISHWRYVDGVLTTEMSVFCWNVWLVDLSFSPYSNYSVLLN